MHTFEGFVSREHTGAVLGSCRVWQAPAVTGGGGRRRQQVLNRHQSRKVKAHLEHPLLFPEISHWKPPFALPHLDEPFQARNVRIHTEIVPRASPSFT